MGLGLLSGRCRLYPQHRKYRCGASTDVVGHKRTHAAQDKRKQKDRLARQASPAQAISALAPEAQMVKLSATLSSAAVNKRERRLILTFSNLPPRREAPFDRRHAGDRNTPISRHL